MPEARTTRIAKRERQRAIRELVARFPIASQQEFAELLGERGFDVTQATVSRDIAELGLVKVVRADRPFLLAIRERLSGTVLFVGLIVQAPGG